MVRAIVSACVLASCAYNGSFSDCAISCTTAGCPDGLTCGAEGLCRLPGQTTTCAAIFRPPPSCVGLPATCGPTASDDCCSIAQPIPGGTFYRSYDVAPDGMYADTSHPATVSAFRLDKYEVTVGRFRKFVETGSGTQVSPPSAGEGTHEKISGSGWDTSWDGALVADTATLSAALQCDTLYQTWTTTPGPNEDLPINCVSWYEAMAFCAWDGGYLPTEAEWNYAAAGGDEQRAYPWSSPAGSTGIDCADANYHPTSICTGTVNRVGSESPRGDGKYGHSDLGGNVWEWLLDWSGQLPIPCVDCANLTTSTYRSIWGGGWFEPAAALRVGSGNSGTPTGRSNGIGLRCARAAQG